MKIGGPDNKFVCLDDRGLYAREIKVLGPGNPVNLPIVGVERIRVLKYVHGRDDLA